LADADLDVCGRDDFLMLNRCLRVELTASGSTISDREWYSNQTTLSNVKNELVTCAIVMYN
jgi:hypothetical protein